MMSSGSGIICFALLYKNEQILKLCLVMKINRTLSRNGEMTFGKHENSHPGNCHPDDFHWRPPTRKITTKENSHP